MKHGTISGYNRHKCRCKECSAAKVTANRKSREKNPDKQKQLARKHYEENKEDYLQRSRNQRIYQKDKCRVWASSRRARVRAAFVEHIDHSVVFLAVDYICQNCGIVCDKDAVYPAKNFPSLDHVIPLSKGGKHSYDNVQLLCLECNLSKSNKIIERSA
jgi:5-methylcytosine-specific restriction endonuclease McrA